jgi:nitrate reductase cytochrome c-type subunit
MADPDRQPPPEPSRVPNNENGITSAEDAPTPPAPPRWKFWRGTPDIVLARATVLLAIATLLLTTLAGIQAYILATTDTSTRMSAEAAVKSANAVDMAGRNAQENFRAEQRPVIWLTNELNKPEFIPNMKKADNTGQIVWSFHYTNYGRTPAVHISFRHFMTTEGKIEESYGALAPAVGAPIPPNKVDFATVVSRPGISQDEFNQLLKNDSAIGISADILYFDAFGNKYETTFCLTHLSSGAILYCKEGNDIK